MFKSNKIILEFPTLIFMLLLFMRVYFLGIYLNYITFINLYNNVDSYLYNKISIHSHTNQLILLVKITPRN